MISPRTGPQEGAKLSPGLVPKHAQLRDLLSDLAAHGLGPDSPIPSERTLMATYGVSRATVRKAIDGLVSDGLLVRVHGRGTFVARPRLESRLHLASFSQDMRRRGLVPSTVLVGIAAESPPVEVAVALGLPAGARDAAEPEASLAWRVDRIRLADGHPIAMENGWYPHQHLPGLDRCDLTGSLYELFQTEYGLTIDSAEQTLWGETTDAVLARRLSAPLNTPLLVFRRVSRAKSLLLEHVVSRYRGDRYAVHMTLGPDEVSRQHVGGESA